MFEIIHALVNGLLRIFVDEGLSAMSGFFPFCSPLEVFSPLYIRDSGVFWCIAELCQNGSLVLSLLHVHLFIDFIYNATYKQ